MRTLRLLHRPAGGQVALLCAMLGIHRVVVGDSFCGVDLDDVQNTCWQPCSTDRDCCSTGQQCLEAEASCGSSILTGTNHFFCGVSWCDAAYKCGTPCPEQTECPDGEGCYGDIPCDGESARVPPPLPSPSTSSPYQFCGSSPEDAAEDCWQPCPWGNSDCCAGLTCHDTSSDDAPGGTCPAADYTGSEHFFCGSSWCTAAYACQDACPGGSSEECPDGEYCYADVPCSPEGVQPPEVDTRSTAFSQYCGTSAENAADSCWQPCRDDDDCCAGQTCYSGVDECRYPDLIGADHFFCGSDFCDASYECRAPCPTGSDAECPAGYRCFANTPCNAKVRSMSANMLDFGLPLKSALLMRQYRPAESQAQFNTARASNQVNHIAAAIGICVAITLVL